jgi:hypothetical protein
MDKDTISYHFRSNFPIPLQRFILRMSFIFTLGISLLLLILLSNSNIGNKSSELWMLLESLGIEKLPSTVLTFLYFITIFVFVYIFLFPIGFLASRDSEKDINKIYKKLFQKKQSQKDIERLKKERIEMLRKWTTFLYPVRRAI